MHRVTDREMVRGILEQVHKTVIKNWGSYKTETWQQEGHGTL